MAMELVFQVSILVGAWVLAAVSIRQEKAILEHYKKHRIPGRCDCLPDDPRCLQD
jgi:hypothetical protein